VDITEIAKAIDYTKPLNTVKAANGMTFNFIMEEGDQSDSSGEIKKIESDSETEFDVDKESS